MSFLVSRLVEHRRLRVCSWPASEWPPLGREMLRFLGHGELPKMHTGVGMPRSDRCRGPGKHQVGAIGWITKIWEQAHCNTGNTRSSPSRKWKGKVRLVEARRIPLVHHFGSCGICRWNLWMVSQTYPGLKLAPGQIEVSLRRFRPHGVEDPMGQRATRYSSARLAPTCGWAFRQHPKTAHRNFATMSCPSHTHRKTGCARFFPSMDHPTTRLKLSSA